MSDIEELVGSQTPPMIIAELSGNHGQSLGRALAIVDAAAAAGAHALKLQTYTPETMTLDIDSDAFRITDPQSLWCGRSLYELYGEASTPWEWHDAIMRRARQRGMIAFSTPFDESAVDFLESLDVPCYKIASFEITDMGLLQRVAKTRKPVILSTGLATLCEIDDAVGTLRSAGCTSLVLLKCTSSYPASPEDSNIATLPALAQHFGCGVGLSDHTLGLGVAVASVALGASVIEKHFTISRTYGGPDSAFSAEPAELAQLVEETRRAWLALGRVRYGPTASETASLKYRRSLYIVRDLNEGDVVQRGDVRAIRPGYGLAPAQIDSVIGMRLTRRAKLGTPVSWDLFKNDAG